MRNIRILSLPSSVADEVRRTRRDEQGNDDLMPQVVTEPHSSPCRACLRDAEVGEEVLLFGYTPFSARHPYRTVGPIFVHLDPRACGTVAGASEVVVTSAADVPEALRRRLLSVHAHDRAGRMVDCDVTRGEELLDLARRFFESPDVSELHVHHARAGCFACRIVPVVA